ncbi:DarT1-associated NADAR antitoxin family protein [Solibacillus sp. FSL K6-1554]|uniref:DarT1-associated NADAR antitoxin family protein n=1 Tax=Solibacillus sp. FSL K6-1554 TaxID=2921472 RepID=UPI0030FA3624
MAKRPVFIANLEGNCYFKEIEVEFSWNGNTDLSDYYKSIESLHENFKLKTTNKYRILEVSTKSKKELGKRLSAFNLHFITKNNQKFTVESLFQGSKVFENGGPYQDLYYKSSLAAKKDGRVKKSGDIIGFKYFNRRFENYPTTYFYDWLYINTLCLNQNLLEEILYYDAFSDIEFNPKYSVNCQAKTLALLKSIVIRGELEAVLENQKFLRDILIQCCSEINQETLF